MKKTTSMSNDFFEFDQYLPYDNSDYADVQAERLSEAKASIFLDAPFFGSIIARMQLYPTTSPLVQKFAADTRRIYFNPLFTSQFSHAKIKMMYLHLIYHLISAHHERHNSRNAEFWNVSVDVISRLLVDETAKNRSQGNRSVISAKSSWEPEDISQIPQLLYDLEAEKIYKILEDYARSYTGTPISQLNPQKHGKIKHSSKNVHGFIDIFAPEVVKIVEEYAGIKDCCSTVIIMEKFKSILKAQEDANIRSSDKKEDETIGDISQKPSTESSDKVNGGLENDENENNLIEGNNNSNQTPNKQNEDGESNSQNGQEEQSNEDSGSSSENSQEDQSNENVGSNSQQNFNNFEKIMNSSESLAFNSEIDRFNGIVQHAYKNHYDKSQGLLPRNIQRFVEDLINPVVPWNNILINYLQKTLMVDWMWSQPNRRFVNQKIYLPSIRKENLEAVIGIDTSGSISPNEIRIFLSEVFGIIQNIASTKLYLISCDAQVHDVIIIEQGRSIDDQTLPWEKGGSLRGGGGTSFVPVFNYVDNELIYPDVLIYFTNMMGTFPSYKPNYPVIWLKTTDRDAPWGQEIRYPIEAQRQKLGI